MFESASPVIFALNPGRDLTGNTTAVNVEKLINHGGSPGGKAEMADATTPVVLHIPTDMLNQIDALVKAQPIKDTTPPLDARSSL